MYHDKANYTKEKNIKNMLLRGNKLDWCFNCVGRLYFLFCISLKISTDCEYNFECGLLKSKTRTSVSLKVSNFKACCNIEIKWFYRLSDIGFFPIFVPIGFFLSIPPGGAKAPPGKGQGVLLGQNPPTVSAPAYCVGVSDRKRSFYWF